jgi:hypothetical protein
MFLYDTTDVKSSVTKVLTNFAALLNAETLPSHVAAEPMFFKLPMGIQFAIIYVWNGPPSPESKSWEEKIAGLGTCVQKAVSSTTPQSALAANDATLPPQIPLHCETVNLTKLSAEAILPIAEAAAAVVSSPTTALGAGVIIHPMLPPSPSVGTHEDSTFLCREPHLMLELIGVSGSPEVAEEAAGWARNLQTKLRATPGIMEATYCPFTTEKSVEAKVFGKHLDFLTAAKQDLDPQGRLKYAYPNLSL